ncbi:hypothetical protein L5515_016813 [Caenorhabditis briggsae]|uniref:Uncharacterized protein n=1 Tax=Caenorhabditis briggsae TaxID=6238 RepID=A0AAE9FD67_CAEBR|nr:hypothetical protein L5515_016813 [Caenorhabditis briggsae]
MEYIRNDRPVGFTDEDFKIIGICQRAMSLTKKITWKSLEPLIKEIEKETLSLVGADVLAQFTMEFVFKQLNGINAEKQKFPKWPMPGNLLTVTLSDAWDKLRSRATNFQKNFEDFKNAQFKFQDEGFKEAHKILLEVFSDRIDRCFDAEIEGSFAETDLVERLQNCNVKTSVAYTISAVFVINNYQVHNVLQMSQVAEKIAVPVAQIRNGKLGNISAVFDFLQFGNEYYKRYMAHKVAVAVVSQEKAFVEFDGYCLVCVLYVRLTAQPLPYFIRMFLKNMTDLRRWPALIIFPNNLEPFNFVQFENPNKEAAEEVPEEPIEYIVVDPDEKAPKTKEPGVVLDVLDLSDDEEPTRAPTPMVVDLQVNMKLEEEAGAADHAEEPDADI